MENKSTVKSLYMSLSIRHYHISAIVKKINDNILRKSPVKFKKRDI